MAAGSASPTYTRRLSRTRTAEDCHGARPANQRRCADPLASAGWPRLAEGATWAKTRPPPPWLHPPRSPKRLPDSPDTWHRFVSHPRLPSAAATRHAHLRAASCARPRPRPPPTVQQQQQQQQRPARLGPQARPGKNRFCWATTWVRAWPWYGTHVHVRRLLREIPWLVACSMTSDTRPGCVGPTPPYLHSIPSAIYTYCCKRQLPLQQSAAAANKL
ncbi:uncharacterized protein SETTUDRAFT_32285 [Exserohilum turcica Et28A]|uniref:Uncharacterized protein n=1 Tax=Exserohilum turcicum (strain 28A) TaxID=671987 RepID=R0IIT1_EXST2|nr:uncharacterized protein SETTUDRAFT_32285 [Exserohilum turcica Et28A]EOA85055.1 hypothetical protein SETTUDRAFT_32285 [Exserohilum turcica Et28A]